MNRCIKHLVFLLTVMLALGATRTSWAGKKICLSWRYTYDDYMVYEDRLLKEAGLDYGVIKAAYARVNVWRDGEKIVGYPTYTDSSGCTPDLGTAAGTYQVQLYPKFSRYSRNVSVYPARDSGWRSFWLTKTLPAGSETTRRAVPSYPDTVANVAAVVTVVLEEYAYWLTTDTHYVYAGDGGPNDCIACYDPPTDSVYLNGFPVGSGGLWYWVALSKFTIAHEFGHYVDARQRGTIDHQYTLLTSDKVACRCEHVKNSKQRSHCMQSNEWSSAAQQEGYAHMFSTIVNNLTSESVMWFGYYKEFMFDGQTVEDPALPPVPLQTWESGARWRWMKDHSCDTSDPKSTGTELDWAEFWFSTRFKTSPKFYPSDLNDIYNRVCGGLPCTTADHSSWDKLKAAVSAQWGALSDEYAVWLQQGEYYGVNDPGAAHGK